MSLSGVGFEDLKASLEKYLDDNYSGQIRWQGTDLNTGNLDDSFWIEPALLPMVPVPSRANVRHELYTYQFNIFSKLSDAHKVYEVADTLNALFRDADIIYYNYPAETDSGGRLRFQEPNLVPLPNTDKVKGLNLSYKFTVIG